jgi:hypothetical protein
MKAYRANEIAAVELLAEKIFLRTKPSIEAKCAHVAQA